MLEGYTCLDRSSACGRTAMPEHGEDRAPPASEAGRVAGTAGELNSDDSIDADAKRGQRGCTLCDVGDLQR